MYEKIRPLLFRFEAERAHQLGTLGGRMGQRLFPGTLKRRFGFESERLRCAVLGIELRNPLGIAAGFDKNARLIPLWEQLGCGFAEIGSVSAAPARGNPRPRVFRLPEDEALINRMGLNNHGASRIGKRLARRDPDGLPVVVSLAKTHDPAILGQTAIEDFETSFRLCAPHASMVVLNLSCPNTEEGKTFEDPNVLDDLLRAINRCRGDLGLAVPVLLKLSPPVADHVVLDSEVDELVAVARAHGAAGFVASNTASSREGLATPQGRIAQIGRGGLSGPPLRSRSTELVRYLYRATDGSLPIIGVGGVATGEHAYEKIRAGASLVQVYTALVYGGPGLFRDIKRELDALLARDGFTSVSAAVGADA